MDGNETETLDAVCEFDAPPTLIVHRSPAAAVETPSQKKSGPRSLDLSIFPDISTFSRSNYSKPSVFPFPTSCNVVALTDQVPIRDMERRRPRARQACLSCRKSKSACEQTRPCARCVRTGKASTCRDGPTSMTLEAVSGSNPDRDTPLQSDPVPPQPQTEQLFMVAPISVSFSETETSLIAVTAASPPTLPSPITNHEFAFAAAPTTENGPQTIIPAATTPSCHISSNTATSSDTLDVDTDIPGWLQISKDFLAQTLALHAFITLGEPTSQMITAIAWVLHNTAHQLEMFHKLSGKESSILALQCPCCQSCTASHTARGHRSSSNLDTSSVHGHTVSDSPQNPFLSAREARSFAQFAPTRSLALPSAGMLVNFLSFSGNREFSSSRLDNVNTPSNASSKQLAVFIPVLNAPSSASCEQRYYACLNTWRQMVPVQRTLQRFFSQGWLNELEVLFRAEQTVARGLPFSIMLVPLFPVVVAALPGWCNKRLALTLGYAEDALSCLTSWDECCRIVTAAGLDRAFQLYREGIMIGRKSCTFRMAWRHKSGRSVETITTMSLRFFECMPMVMVLYAQPDPRMQRS